MVADHTLPAVGNRQTDGAPEDRALWVAIPELAETWGIEMIELEFSREDVQNHGADRQLCRLIHQTDGRSAQSRNRPVSPR